MNNLTRSVCIYFTAAHPESSFDVVLSGVTLSSQLVHSLDLLAEIARILKPSGKLTLTEPIGKIDCNNVGNTPNFLMESKCLKWALV